MFSVLQKKRLSRRAMLRGAGVAVALPWLDAMLPALATKSEAAEALAPPKRFVAINYGLGFHGPHLFPEQAARITCRRRISNCFRSIAISSP